MGCRLFTYAISLGQLLAKHAYMFASALAAKVGLPEVFSNVGESQAVSQASGKSHPIACHAQKWCCVGGHPQELLHTAAGLPYEIFQGFCGSHPSAASACSWA